MPSIFHSRPLQMIAQRWLRSITWRINVAWKYCQPHKEDGMKLNRRVAWCFIIIFYGTLCLVFLEAIDFLGKRQIQGVLRSLLLDVFYIGNCHIPQRNGIIFLMFWWVYCHALVWYCDLQCNLILFNRKQDQMYSVQLALRWVHIGLAVDIA